MAKVIELLKQYIEERKIDMKKWQLCIGFGYDREEAAAFQKQLLSALGGIITEAECPCFRLEQQFQFIQVRIRLALDLLESRRFVNKIKKSQPCFTTVWDFLCHMDT